MCYIYRRIMMYGHSMLFDTFREKERGREKKTREKYKCEYNIIKGEK